MRIGINGSWRDSWKEHSFIVRLACLNYICMRSEVILSLGQKYDLIKLLRQKLALIHCLYFFFLIKCFEVKFQKFLKRSNLSYFFFILCLWDRI